MVFWRQPRTSRGKRLEHARGGTGGSTDAADATGCWHVHELGSRTITSATRAMPTVRWANVRLCTRSGCVEAHREEVAHEALLASAGSPVRAVSGWPSARW